MTGNISRGVLSCAALVAALGVLTACGDSSTVSAPLSPVVTTTSMSSGTGASSTTSSSAPSSSSAASAPTSKAPRSSVEAAETSQAQEAAEKATKTLPATKPEKKTPVPGNFPGSPQGDGGQQLTDKDKAYLAALKRDDVAFMGDDDNNVALTMGHYVCAERAKKTDPTLVKVYVRAAIGPMTKSEAEAGTKADKLIAAADKNLC